jgi:hypothetical protein
VKQQRPSSREDRCLLRWANWQSATPAARGGGDASDVCRMCARPEPTSAPTRPVLARPRAGRSSMIEAGQRRGGGAKHNQARSQRERAPCQRASVPAPEPRLRPRRNTLDEARMCVAQVSSLDAAKLPDGPPTTATHCCSPASAGPRSAVTSACTAAPRVAHTPRPPLGSAQACAAQLAARSAQAMALTCKSAGQE